MHAIRNPKESKNKYSKTTKYEEKLYLVKGRCLSVNVSDCFIYHIYNN